MVKPNIELLIMRMNSWLACLVYLVISAPRKPQTKPKMTPPPATTKNLDKGQKTIKLINNIRSSYYLVNPSQLLHVHNLHLIYQIHYQLRCKQILQKLFRLIYAAYNMRFILELLVCNSLLRCNNLIMSRVSMIGANLGVANDEPPSEFHITSLHVILSLRS